MTTDVYGDILFLINAGMDCLSCLLTARLLRRHIRGGRLALASLLGGVYAVAALFVNVGRAAALALDCLMCLCLCALVFLPGQEAGRRRWLSVFPACGVYLLVSLVLGGVMTGLYNLLNRAGCPDALAGMGADGPTAWLFALLALLTGGCLVYYFSRRNVRPIIELGQELQTAVEVQKNLQEVVDSQRPIICTSYVRQLLSGTATSEDEVTYMENYLGIADSSYYNVLYIVYYNNFGDNTEITLPGGVESMEELEKIIETALENFFGTPLFYFSPSDRTYSVLLHCSEEEEKDLILKINNCILRLHDYLLDTYDIWLFAGIGRNTDSLMNVWECYQQASEAVSYTTKNYIFFPYEFIKKDSNVFYYPPEISTKLIHFISTGNTPQVLEMFNLIHQENIEERTLPVNLLKYLLSDIRNTLLKARFALPQDADPEAVKVLDERFNEHLTFKLCEDLALSLCNLFGNKEDDNTLSATIEKYIKENYKDPSLGLNKISDEFQISESYFSHMFKEKTGVNFSTYLENIRMTEAARLIKETDISLNELYIAVGYNNSNTFRRAFKKVYGVTPSAMREK